MPASLSQGETLTVEATSLYLREGPGLSYAPIGSLQYNDELTVKERNKDWVRVQTRDGQTGWIASWFTSATKTTTNTSATQATVTATSLRVRSGPDTSYDVVGNVNKGDRLTIETKEGNWAQISYSTVDGWVSLDYIQELNSDTRTENLEQETMTGIVNATVLNVRTEASSSASIATQYENGKQIDIIGTTGDYYETEDGFVHKDYIVVSEDRSSNVQQATATIAGLQIRTRPSYTGEVVDSLLKGEKISIKKRQGPWVMIENTSGKEGWITSWFLDTGTSTLSSQTIQLLYEGTNIRSAPSTDSPIIERGQAFQEYEVTGTLGDWYELKLESGKGYVASWIVEELSETTTQDGLEGKRILLDPGHGGVDEGTRGSSGTKEKELSLQTSLALQKRLEQAGAFVTLTRGDDSFVELRNRARMSSFTGADLFISIHYDAVEDTSVRGTTTYYYHPTHKRMSDTIQKALSTSTDLEDRGSRYGNYLVLRENTVPSILVELGFLSNPSEEAYMMTDAFQESAVDGLFAGIEDYFSN